MNLKRKLAKLTDKQVHKLRLALEQKKVAENLDEDVETLESHYSPDSGVVENFVRRHRSKSRTKNAIQQTGEIKAATGLRSEAITAAHTLQEARPRLEERRRLEQVTHNNEVARTGEATARKVSPKILDELVLVEHKTNETIRLKDAESKISIGEYKQKKDIDVAADLQETINTIEGILIYSNIRYEAFNNLKRKAIDAIRDLKRAMETGASVDEIQLLTETVETFRELFNVQKNRLLEAAPGQVEERFTEIAKAVGVQRVSGGTDEE